MFDSSKVNEPSVFELLRFYCRCNENIISADEYEYMNTPVKCVMYGEVAITDTT